MKAVLDVLLLGLALIYQLGFGATLSFKGVGLDLICVCLCSLAIWQGPAYGAVSGLLAGLVLDGLFGHFGFFASGYLAVGLFAGYLADKLRFDRVVAPLLCFAVLYLVKELPALAYLFFADVPISWPLAMLKLLGCALLGAAVFLPVHLGLGKLHAWEVIQAPLFRRGKW